MTQNPLVSIITPSYNQAAFLEQTLRSVLGQDYEPIEYLIIDGASTDGSLEIIQRYADRLTWWVSEPDQGQADAINKGLRQAKGDFVAWLNSDDLYMPGAVSRAIAALRENPNLGMVFGDAISIDTSGKPIHKLTFGNWGLAELIRFRIICQPTVFIRRNILERAGFLDLTYHFMLDHHLWIRMARLAPIQYISADQQTFSPIAAARQHPSAKNVAQAADFGRETMRILEWLQDQPDLASVIAQNPNRVRAGAYRLNARYLLDGNMPWAALKSYNRALMAWPDFALQHWHRIVYAALCVLRIDCLTNPLRTFSSKQQRRRLVAELQRYRLPSSYSKTSPEINTTSLDKWPGLCLEV